MPSDPPSWKFHQHRPGGAWDGMGIQMVIRTEIDNFVREVVQNVIDQRLSIENPAQVEFVVQDHDGADADRLLELIGWDLGLKRHMKGVADGENHLSERLKVAISSADNRSIRTLTIRDSGTKGLTGPEEHTGNFANLCRHVMVTDHGGKARGGAFGIGKSVLWAFSRGSVVFFSSRFFDEDKKSIDYRAIGRSFFPSHRTDEIHENQRFEGNAWFGANETTSDGQWTWTKSLRSLEARDFCVGTPLERSDATTGTSIMIPFFGSPVEEEDKTGDELAKSLETSIVKWFWPAIHDGLLEASVEFVDSKGLSSKTAVSLDPWIGPYIRLLETQEKEELASEPGSVAGADISLDVPERKARDNRHKALSAPVKLAVTRLTDEEVEHIPGEMLNAVALVRGVRMVVQYLGGMSESLPAFVGVLKAGTLHGNGELDGAAEYFLRDSEPPAHDKWEATPKIRENYRAGGQASLRRLLENIRVNTKKLLGSTAGGEGKVPKKLAELLKGRRPGAERKPRSAQKTVVREPTISRTGLEATGTCKVTGPANKPWTTYLRLVAITEDNRKIPLDHSSSNAKWPDDLGVTLGNDETVTDKVSGQSVVPGLLISVPANVAEVQIEFSASATFLGAEVFRRSRIEVSSKKGRNSGNTSSEREEDNG